ncbi:extracellular solute-binding protein [Streptomyces sp. SID8361]|uniref:ABC transporter substrate-binding protein n=1 Tax=Streptomyces sp. MnatMP-M27 TaxID=1839768 RepID=UPI00081D5B02|nr:sugar ABC transporter substrate-binding protein [Streptomyces sp. MnatMP-M27]MYU13813.1 extracellular solute-binding protein [Streptomyces sp. SID8361]SCG02808.1 carbohydrate ABC transporter substrate-binding protein, CUT1 family [Streptomyces sp. MnatMP-M27]
MPGQRRPGRPVTGRRATAGTTALLTLLALVLAGCAGCSTHRAADTAGDGPVRLTFWSPLRGSQEVVDEFNRTHDTIEVDFQQVPSGEQGGWAKLSNAARAGNAPDVATIEYPQLPGFTIDGVPRDISELLPDSVRRKILPQALDLTTFDGRTYAVPVDIEPMVFLYRKDIFTRNHIPVPKTWAEFESSARKLKQAQPRSRIASLFTTGGTLYLAGYAWQAGAQWYRTSDDTWHISMDDAPTRKVATYWQRLMDNDLVRVEPGSSQQWRAHIQSGETAGYLAGAWAAGSMMSSTPGGKGKWAIAPMPQWDPAEPKVSTQGGSTFLVTKDSHHPEEAMEFISWMVTSPGALKAKLASGVSSAFPSVPGLVPVARKEMDTSYYSGQDIFGLFQEQAEMISPTWKWGPRMVSTTTSGDDGLARAGAGSGTILEALREAQSRTMPDLKSLGLSVTTR